MNMLPIVFSLFCGCHNPPDFFPFSGKNPGGLWQPQKSSVRPDGDYVAEIAKWRTDREAEIRADDSWLTVAGLFWLKEGRNRAGANPTFEVTLPSGSAPDWLGDFVLSDGEVRFDAAPGVDVSERDGVVRYRTLTMFAITRLDRQAIRLRDANHPARRAFTGLKWYPADERWRIPGRFIPHPGGERRVPIANVLGGEVQMANPGVVELAIAGTTHRLEALYETDERRDLWILFRDETSHSETYEAGRYLRVDLPVAGRVVVDFNKAYNPPCAFTEYATCPLPPAANRLPVAIEAGEKRPH
jgi:uncharacterized protein (DUF1684 family)